MMEGISAAAAVPRQASRRTLRKSSFIWGRIITSSRLELDCVILDISPTGARIKSQHLGPVGEYVELIGPDGGPTQARVMWRRGQEMGLNYQARPAPRISPILQAVADRMQA